MTHHSSWKTPQNFLIIISIVVPIAFSSWMALLNNFVIERANFDGSDIGLLQSVREIMAFWRSLLSLFWCSFESRSSFCLHLAP